MTGQNVFYIAENDLNSMMNAEWSMQVMALNATTRSSGGLVYINIHIGSKQRRLVTTEKKKGMSKTHKRKEKAMQTGLWQRSSKT